MSPRMKLNQEQKQAIEHQQGPLLIIAGAGTGKTTVVTERIKYLISSQQAKPSEILALTFTDKAAREMEERVDVALPYGYTNLWISTFHSFADRILRDNALQIGLDPRFKLMTQARAIKFLRDNLFEFDLHYYRPLGNPTKFVGGLLEHFSRLQDEDVLPREYLRWAQKQKRQRRGGKTKFQSSDQLEIQKWFELAQAYKKYDELKTRAGVMDFGDLIVKTLLLFRQRPNILRQYQRQFKHLLVDEYQDTNISQNELVKLLAGKRGNITVVADDDQSIYKWRGAAVSNVLDFKKNFPKVKIVTLTRNYRSQQEILDRAYDLIQHNNPDRLEVKENIDKKLKSMVNSKSGTKAQSRGKTISFFHLDRVENEAEKVVQEIRKLTKGKKQWEYKDVAILVRANNHAEPFLRALGRQGIPYQFLGPGRLFKQSEILDLISYLKVLLDPDDSISLYRLLSIDYFDINARDLIRIASYARRKNLSLFEASEQIEKIGVLKETAKKLNKLKKIIKKHLKLIRRESAGQILYYFLEETGLIQKLINPDEVQAEKKAANISKFFDKLKTYEVDNEDATVPAVLDWIELSQEVGESPLAADLDWTEINAVNLLTTHSAKGLEFPIVFLVNLVSQRFPTIERREQIPIPEELIKETLPQGDFHLQEERRLFYVGMTRAKEKLYLTAANYYGEGKREKRLSPFIFEALGDALVRSEQTILQDQLSFLDFKQAQLPKTTPSAKIHVDYLSYSQIETFKTCPLHYKLRYLLNIPSRPSAAMSLGTSLHETLKNFYLHFQAGKKPTLNLMYKLLDQAWLNEGYTSKSHEKQMHEKGRGFLKDYFKNEFNSHKKPLLLEEPFVVPIQVSGQKHRPLKIGGKIDRADKLYGGGIEIVDYKTGANVPTQRQIDHDLQLTIYALAATSIKEYPFNQKPEKVKLTLYYFDGQKKISTTRTRQQLREAKKEILKIRAEIEKSDFACSNHFFCQNCEYQMFCKSDN